MAEETSIVLTMYDKVSPAMKTIANNTRAFSKELQVLEQACAAYEKKQAILVKDISNMKSKLAESNEKVKDAKKAWKSLQDETSKGIMDAAIQEQEEFKAKLKDRSAALNSLAA